MNDEMESVVLVDEKDIPVGLAAKLDAHRRALRHRAFSVILKDRNGHILLQKRAASKYHSGGLWTNACCGHPRAGEPTETAASRRLYEEMGMRVPLQFQGQIAYEAMLPNGWFENEIVHLFLGVSEDDPSPDPTEVDAWLKIEPAELLARVCSEPEAFTAWFRLYVEKLPHLLGGEG